MAVRQWHRQFARLSWASWPCFTKFAASPSIQVCHGPGSDSAESQARARARPVAARAGAESLLSKVARHAKGPRAGRARAARPPQRARGPGPSAAGLSESDVGRRSARRRRAAAAGPRPLRPHPGPPGSAAAAAGSVMVSLSRVTVTTQYSADVSHSSAKPPGCYYM
jgi:hypothetical protein